MTLTYITWHHHVCVVIRNKIWMFYEEILRNDNVIANVKLSWLTDWQTNRRTSRSLRIAFFKGRYKKRVTVPDSPWAPRSSGLRRQRQSWVPGSCRPRDDGCASRDTPSSRLQMGNGAKRFGIIIIVLFVFVLDKHK